MQRELASIRMQSRNHFSSLLRSCAHRQERHPKEWLFAALALTVIGGCSERRAEFQGTLFSDSAGIHIAYTQIDSTARVCPLSENTVRIGTLAGDSASQLFRVRDATGLGAGRIAVLNAGSWQVKIFDSAGDIVTEFGRRGQGPGEFKNLWSLDRTGSDTLVIGEYRPWRFSFFTVAGEFLQSVELRPWVIERPEVGMVLSRESGFLIGERCCFTDDQDFTDETLIISRYDRDGMLVDTVTSFWFQKVGFLSRELRYVGSPIFGARAGLAYYPGDTILYASGQVEQVEFWTADGEISRVVRWSARDRRVRGEDAQEWKRQFREAFAGDLSSPRASELLQAQVGDQRPIADTFPAIDQWGGLLATRAGFVWVKDFRRPFDEGADRWFVFYPSGEFACQVRTPEAMYLLEVGEDYILAVERDELDVEYIVQRSLSLPNTSRN